MDPTLGIIESGDLLIDGGKIIAVGKNVGSWAVTEIDGRGMIAMPGFINGHIPGRPHCGVLLQTGHSTITLVC
jgi:cytosine/adenosine deaminase-related metal-dependent hydrolase